jgi:hypothetical protein
LIVRIGLIAPMLAAAVTLQAPGVLAATPPRPVGPDSFGIQLLGSANAALTNPLARTYIVSGLAPGTSITRVVEISNTTRSTADVVVYAAAASFNHGIFAFASGRSQNDLSRWTSMSQDVLRVPAGGAAFDTVTIDVPKLASAGERYAVVWAAMSTTAQVGHGVVLVNRVGVRMYVSIGHGGLPVANFRVGGLGGRRSAAGQPLVFANIHNSGQRTLALVGELTLADGPGGLVAGPFPVKLGAALAPGDSELLTVTLNKILPRGPWQAKIRLSSGPLARTATATITFPRAR